ncbi:MAG: PqqD family protein [Muribaculaceae bacterium]|nr:PqqD family protein [Muribaculaceae bacterium]
MKIAQNISWKKLQDKVVAVNLTTGTYYTMNVVASTVWNLLADGLSPQEIALKLSEEYDQSQESILNDVNDQIEYWVKENLLETA